jgi:hypothetical protein
MSYFVMRYCQIYNATEREWLPFDLWPAQKRVIRELRTQRLIVILKARQLGLSWLCLAYALWQMRFHPAATVLIFSKRDEEASELLGRIKGMDSRLPDWLRATAIIAANNGHAYELANGSKAHAFPTTGGRSYTGSLVLVDEADFMPDLDGQINAVKPTVDAGGQMVMISTVDKSQPESPFKRIYRGAKAGATEWRAVFLSWRDRPGRTAEWYEAQRADAFARTGSLDDLHQEYPASPEEALAPRQLDKRIPAAWLNEVYREQKGTNPLGIPGLTVYGTPQQYADPVRKAGQVHYRIGCDIAEGNPSSDDSAATVVEERSGEEVAVLCGKLQPSTFAAYVARLAEWYNGASVLVERNNHGHAVLLWLADNSKANVLAGPDERPGWPTTSKSKAIMYSDFVDQVRDHEMTIHSFESYMQLASIDGSTLNAPDGLHDDRAVSFVLATLSAQLLAPKKKAGTW